MSELGSIYEDAGDEAPGPDLHTVLEIPRGDLGKAVKVKVPLALPMDDGELIERADRAGEGDVITLQLPAELPDGATLRLRGEGGVVDGGPGGDLYLQIRLVDVAPPTRPVGGWLVAGLVMLAAVAGWVLTR
ncbi:MAG: hypothetical protein H6702_15215 [Myxococcales bacterium]|nr:hypothetical protein [Myxococcales bacterium]